jgi:hypothetical protein
MYIYICYILICIYRISLKLYSICMQLNSIDEGCQISYHSMEQHIAPGMYVLFHSNSKWRPFDEALWSSITFILVNHLLLKWELKLLFVLPLVRNPSSMTLCYGTTLTIKSEIITIIWFPLVYRNLTINPNTLLLLWIDHFIYLAY